MAYISKQHLVIQPELLKSKRFSFELRKILYNMTHVNIVNFPENENNFEKQNQLCMKEWSISKESTDLVSKKSVFELNCITVKYMHLHTFLWKQILFDNFQITF